jgi:ABC-type bacteriocin/lantibiotic exporter with double-glycine peptidase domain
MEMFKEINKRVHLFVIQKKNCTRRKLLQNDVNIRLSKVGFTYPGNTTPTFTNLNLTIRKGDCIGILGKIGSGKSTLLKIMLKFLEGYRGSIKINGNELVNICPHDVRRIIAYIPQTISLFDRTIMENILYGTNGTEKEAEKIARELGVYRDLKKMPKGFNTPCGAYGGHLSGGQRQLIYTMRAVISNKPVLLFDEPTSSLDLNGRKKIENVIKKLKLMNKTIIVITHDEALTRVLDTVTYI